MTAPWLVPHMPESADYPMNRTSGHSGYVVCVESFELDLLLSMDLVQALLMSADAALSRSSSPEGCRRGRLRYSSTALYSQE
jgi:hypothetical protein